MKPYIIYEDESSHKRSLAYNDIWNESYAFHDFRRLDIEIEHQNYYHTLIFYPEYLNNDYGKTYAFSFGTLNLSDGALRTIAGTLKFNGRYITNAIAKMMYENNKPVDLDVSEIYIKKIIGYAPNY